MIDSAEKHVSLKSDVTSFYHGRSIFLTGVTGFVGKVWHDMAILHIKPLTDLNSLSLQVGLEKVLRSLPDVGKVYVLLRPKKGLTVNERLKELLSSQCFSFHTQSPTQVSKVVAVTGDVTQSLFGLSDQDVKRISSTVSVVIHAAASIRFDSLLA